MKLRLLVIMLTACLFAVTSCDENQYGPAGHVPDQEQEDERAFIAKDAAQLVDTGGDNSEHKGLRFRRPTPVPSLYGGA